MKYEIECRFNPGRIEVDVSYVDPLRDLSACIRRSVIDLEEKACRDALIALGWTPPAHASGGYQPVSDGREAVPPGAE